jgi:hypothetical protein
VIYPHSRTQSYRRRLSGVGSAGFSEPKVADVGGARKQLDILEAIVAAEAQRRRRPDRPLGKIQYED